MYNINMSERLAQTIMARYPNPDQYPYKSWSYSQGFMLWGMIKLWEATGDKKYFDYVMKYSDFHVDETGNIKEFAGDSLDDIMAGSILVWSYSQTGINKYRLACEKIRSVFNTYPRTAEGAFWHARSLPDEIWVDGVFMGQMFLGRYGKYIADSKTCFSEAVKQVQLIKKYCKKDESGLLVHAWSGNEAVQWADKNTGCSPEVWSEGLGWYALILVETLALFPDDFPQKEILENELEYLLEGLKKYQSPKNGMWYQVVDKGERPDNWNDTSGSAMFVYAICKAIQLGYANKETYGPIALKGYEGILSKAKVNNQGLIDIYDACDGLCVQKSYDNYVQYPKCTNAKEAVAAFLWASGIMDHYKPEHTKG